MNLTANLSLVEVADIEDATHIFLESKQLGLKLNENKLYQLYREEYKTYDYEGTVTMIEYYIFDESGNKNYGVLATTNCKLFKLIVE